MSVAVRRLSRVELMDQEERHSKSLTRCVHEESLHSILKIQFRDVATNQAFKSLSRSRSSCLVCVVPSHINNIAPWSVTSRGFAPPTLQQGEAARTETKNTKRKRNRTW